MTRWCAAPDPASVMKSLQLQVVIYRSLSLKEILRGE